MQPSSLIAPPTARLALCRLPGHAALPALLERLPAAMRLEIARSRRAEDQRARALARLLLRRLLAEAGLDAEADLHGWRREAGGRPALAGGAADFSISHAGGWVGVAFGTGLRVGFDLEPWQAIDRADHAALLTDREQADISRAADPAQALLRRWCLREAVLKADGRGFALDAAAIRAIGDGCYPDGRNWIVSFPEWNHGALALACDRPVSWARAEFDPQALIGTCPLLD